MKRVGKKGMYLNEESLTWQISGNEDDRWRQRHFSAHTAAITNTEAPGSFSQSQTQKATIPKLMSQMFQRERKADLKQDNC